MLTINQDPDEYEDKLKAVREECKRQLESKGLYVEYTSGEIGLNVSLTSFGLTSVYATITQEEFEYIVDNEVEL